MKPAPAVQPAADSGQIMPWETPEQKAFAADIKNDMIGMPAC